MPGSTPAPWIDELLDRRLLVREAADQFAFRHSLARDAVYSTLLRGERRALHEAVGAAIQDLFADHLDSHLGELAHHFYLAEDWEQAAAYARQAGERAQAAYANQEAIEHFSRAIAALGQLPRPAGLAALRRLRAQAYDTTGRFERAHADHEAALALARAEGDQQAEWQALVDLGLLWASRDYERSGDYLKQALDLARAMGDAAILGQTLNRLGNWRLNLLEFDEARGYHREALEIFRGLQDRSGLAATLDLLGMLSALAGDLFAGDRYLKEAVELWSQIEEPRGLIFSQSSQGIAHYFSQTRTLVTRRSTLEEAIGPSEAALASAREMGWRAAEAYALGMIGSNLAGRGRFGRALACGEAALFIAQEIDHRQWTVFSLYLLGSIHLDFLAADEARSFAERALPLADEIHSRFWQAMLASLAALAVLAAGDPAAARAILQARLPLASQMNHLPGRTARAAWAELALGEGRSADALALVDDLLASAANVAESGAQALPYLLWLKGRALRALGRDAEAVAVLEEAREGAQAREARPLLWQVRAALAECCRQLGRPDQAAVADAAAAAAAAELAAEIPDPALRDNFLRRAGQAGVRP